MIHIDKRWLNKLQKQNIQKKVSHNDAPKLKTPKGNFIVELHFESGKHVGKAVPL